MIELLQEANISFYADKSNIPTKRESVFYNVNAKLSRDLITLIAINEKSKYISDLHAGSGIMSLRIANAIPVDKITLYDTNPKAIKTIIKNFSLNKIKNYDARLLNSTQADIKQSDLILIDPFGSPAEHYKTIIKDAKQNSIISLKATDAGVLFGNYPKTARKRYDLNINKNPAPKEFAIRSLLLFAENYANKYKKSIKPLLSYSTNYYIHCIFKIIKQRKQKKHTLNYCEKCLNTNIGEKETQCICNNKFKHTDFLNVPKSDKKTIKQIMLTTSDKKILKELEKALQQDLKTHIYSIPKLCKKLHRLIPKSETFKKEGAKLLAYDKDCITTNKIYGI